MTDDLLPGWTTAPVGSIAALIRGVTFRKSEALSHSTADSVPILRAGNVRDGRVQLGEDLVYVPQDRVSDGQLLRAGDTLIATSSGSASVVGKSALVVNDWHGAHGAFMAVLRPHAGIEPAYLAYYLQSEKVRHQWRTAAAGTNINNLKRRDLLSTEVALCPVEHQRRIVAAIEEHFSRLDAVDGIVASARRRLDALQNAIMDRAFYSREGTVPVGKIGDLAEVSGGIQKQPKRRPHENRYPFLRVANVGRGQLSLSEVHEIELFEGEIDRFRLKQGDLLVVEGNGSANQIGRAALWGGEIDDCVHQNHLIRVRPRDELLPEYLVLCWNAPRTAQQVREVASSTSGLYTLSTSKVKSIRIPIVPLPVQAEIVGVLEQRLRHLEMARCAAMDAEVRTRALRRAVLARAFAGQLISHSAVDDSVK